jgi:hypothetical protein
MKLWPLEGYAKGLLSSPLKNFSVRSIFQLSGLRHNPGWIEFRADFHTYNQLEKLILE